MKWILNFLYVLLLTLLSPVILWRNLRHGRYRQGWKEKLLGRLPTFSSDSEVIWFHAVSVGEVLQLQHGNDEGDSKAPNAASAGRRTSTGPPTVSSRLYVFAHNNLRIILT